MFGFPSVNLYMGVTLLAAATGAWFLWSSTRGQLDQMIAQNAKLEAIIQKHEEVNTKNREAISELTASFAEVEYRFKELQDEFQVTRMQDDLLSDKLNEHDLEKLALAKPDLVEKIINNATSESFRCFELLSGAPLNKKEKEASDEKSFNSECPWLFYNP